MQVQAVATAMVAALEYMYILDTALIQVSMKASCVSQSNRQQTPEKG